MRVREWQTILSQAAVKRGKSTPRTIRGQETKERTAKKLARQVVVCMELAEAYGIDLETEIRALHEELKAGVA